MRIGEPISLTHHSSGRSILLIDPPIYIFLDESGNLDFSPSGTRYFVLTSVSMTRPFPARELLDSLRYDLIQSGLDLESFHAAEDSKAVRADVFACIAAALDSLRIHSLIVEKPKTGPALTTEARFYPEMLGYLLKYVLPREDNVGNRMLIVITDTLPVKRQRQAVAKGIQRVLNTTIPAQVSYRILHHTSRSHYGLQIADYCSWAIFRKWERNDPLHYQQISPAINSEFDIFRRGSTFYY